MTGTIKAVLGPTNTGKTHYAVERMLAYSSGVMGFPLRLLAREVYDRVVTIKGKNQVALLTGEERIVPKGARYFLCTAEAMPRHTTADFVAIDEVQMAADPQRGHIFTEHLLHSRGRFETLLLGTATMWPIIRRLIPEAELLIRERFSQLSHVKPARISKLPRRSAVVGFSASEVYGMAELMRRQKGGAAIVMGALSPRTRNAQIDMYMSGEVDYLVATDAIGMGLNLDVGHVAFSALTKFDGRTFRGLSVAEAAQIAGRAGRYKKDGTFSTLGSGPDEAMDPMMIAQIEEHQFEPVKHIFWRNNRLNYSSIPRLLRSLEEPASTDGLHRTGDSLDLLTLKALTADDEISSLAQHKEAVERLWNVCQIPDFRRLSKEDHVGLLRRIYVDLMGPAGAIPHDWFARQVKRLDNMVGDIDTLAGRIASIRVWTYVSHRNDWLQDSAHWAHVTRSIEDRLSDALHEKLTQRFVDKRTAVLMRSLRQRDALSVSIDSDTNQVSVEGHEIGELHGFSFKVETDAAPDDQKTLKAAAEVALKVELTRRAKLFANVGHKTLEFNFDEGLAFPKLMWEGAAVATVHDSGALFGPRVKLAQNILLEGDNADLVREKTQEWLDTRIAEKLEPLVKLAQELNGEIDVPEDAAPLSGLARGVAFRLLEHYGVMARSKVDADLKQLDQDARKGLRRFGIRIGASNLYMPVVMKPHATEMRLAMWAMAGKKADLPSLPTPGMVWVDTVESAPNEFYELAGFKPVGKKAVRMDMFERLADAVRPLGQNRDWFEVTPEVMGLVGLSGEAFAEVMRGAGYKHELRKVAPAAKEVAVEAPTEEPAVVSTEEAAVAATEPVTEGAAESPVETPAVKAETTAMDNTETAPEPAEARVSETSVSESATEDAVEKPAGDETAVDTSVEATSEAPAAEESSVVEVAEEDLVERFFFMWAPKRKPNAGQGRGRPVNKTANKPANKAVGDKPSRRAQIKNNKKHKANASAGASRPPKREKKADPDSPFAALAGLKDALSKK